MTIHDHFYIMRQIWEDQKKQADQPDQIFSWSFWDHIIITASDKDKRQ